MDGLKERFSLSTYDGRWEEYFASSRFIANRRTYLAVRVFLFLAILAIFAWSVAHAVRNGYGRCYLFYLTNQGLVIESAYFGFAVWTTAAAFRVDAKETPWYVKAAWILQDVALPLTCLIFLLYWLTIYSGGTPNPMTPFTHGANFAIMAIDQILTNAPSRLVHGIYVLLYASLYLVWTAVHFAAKLGNCEGDRYIYPTLNWKKSDQTAIFAFIILLVVAPACVCAFWFCCQARGKALKSARDGGDASEQEIELISRNAC